VPSWTLLNLTQDICPLRITQNISKYLKIALYVIYKTQKRFGFGWMLVFHGLSLQIVGPAYLVFLVFIPCCWYFNRSWSHPILIQCDGRNPKEIPKMDILVFDQFPFCVFMQHSADPTYFYCRSWVQYGSIRWKIHFSKASIQIYTILTVYDCINVCIGNNIYELHIWCTCL